MDADLAAAIELAEDLAEQFGPSIMTDAFWVQFRAIVEDVARSPVIGPQPN